MTNRLLSVSMSPHVHSGNSVNKIMYGVVIAMLPALAVSLFYFGLGALQVTLIAVAACLCAGNNPGLSCPGNGLRFVPNLSNIAVSSSVGSKLYNGR